jgi:hypothetical protein
VFHTRIASDLHAIRNSAVLQQSLIVYPFLLFLLLVFQHIKAVLYVRAAGSCQWLYIFVYSIGYVVIVVCCLRLSVSVIKEGRKERIKCVVSAVKG